MVNVWMKWIHIGVRANLDTKGKTAKVIIAINHMYMQSTFFIILGLC